MKKNLLFVFTMLCALSLFTGCSDNDDDKKKDVPFEKETLSFDGNELKLTYSKAAMLGKEVTFLTNDGQTATITLLGGDLDITGLMSMMGTKASPLESLTPGVIPGQTSTVISNVALTQVGDTYTFEGKTEVGGADILYNNNDSFI